MKHPTVPLPFIGQRKKILFRSFRNTRQEVDVERNPNSSPVVESPDEIPKAEDDLDRALSGPRRRQRQTRDRVLKAERHQRHRIPHYLQVESASATARDAIGGKRTQEDARGRKLTQRVHTREIQAMHGSQSG